MTFTNLCLLAGAALSITASNAALAQYDMGDDRHEGGTLVLASAMPALRRTAPAPAATANPYESIVATTAPALVTIKFTMKISSQQRGESERPMEVAGVMIRPDGMVLASNVVLNPASVNPGGVTAVPTDIKVLIGDDTEGVTASLIATDKELDLAWVKIEKPDAAGYKSIDLAASGAPALGSDIVSVERMGKLVDRAPKISIGRAAGTAAKPRKLYMVDGLDTYPGAPTFSVEGKFLGVMSFQFPDGEADESAMDDLRRLGLVILPAESIASATKRVLEQEVERAKTRGDAPKTEPAPAEGDKK